MRYLLLRAAMLSVLFAAIVHAAPDRKEDCAPKVTIKFGYVDEQNSFIVLKSHVMTKDEYACLSNPIREKSASNHRFVVQNEVRFYVEDLFLFPLGHSSQERKDTVVRLANVLLKCLSFISKEGFVFPPAGRTTFREDKIGERAFKIAVLRLILHADVLKL